MRCATSFFRSPRRQSTVCSHPGGRGFASTTFRHQARPPAQAPDPDPHLRHPGRSQARVLRGRLGAHDDGNSVGEFFQTLSITRVNRLDPNAGAPELGPRCCFEALQDVERTLPFPLRRAELTLHRAQPRCAQARHREVPEPAPESAYTKPPPPLSAAPPPSAKHYADIPVRQRTIHPHTLTGNNW